MRPETEEMDNPRRGTTVVRKKEKEWNENFICWNGEQRYPKLSGKEQLKIPWEKLLESW